MTHPKLAALTCLARAPVPYKAGTAPAGDEQDQACLPPARSEPRAAGGPGVGGVPRHERPAPGPVPGHQGRAQ